MYEVLAAALRLVRWNASLIKSQDPVPGGRTHFHADLTSSVSTAASGPCAIDIYARFPCLSGSMTSCFLICNFLPHDAY